MKKNILVLIMSFFTYCIYAIGPIQTYMQEHNLTYPIHFDDSTTNTKYFSPEGYDGYTDTEVKGKELTNQQKKLLQNFIKKFKSDKKYIDDLKKHTGTNNFSTHPIQIHWSVYPGADFFYMGITCYTLEKHGDMSTYNEEYKIWITSNIAVFSTEDNVFEFEGWVF